MSNGDCDGTADHEALARREAAREARLEARVQASAERELAYLERAAKRDYPGIARALDDYDEREAARRADNSEAALRRSVSRLKLKRCEAPTEYTARWAPVARRLVGMPCGHTVPANPLRPDWCSTCERLTGGVE
jgi:hypothetical protein